MGSVPGCCRLLCWLASALSLTASESERGRLCGLLLVSLAAGLSQGYLPSTAYSTWSRWARGGERASGPSPRRLHWRERYTAAAPVAGFCFRYTCCHKVERAVKCFVRLLYELGEGVVSYVTWKPTRAKIPRLAVDGCDRSRDFCLVSFHRRIRGYVREGGYNLVGNRCFLSRLWCTWYPIGFCRNIGNWFFWGNVRKEVEMKE